MKNDTAIAKVVKMQKIIKMKVFWKTYCFSGTVPWETIPN